MSDHLQRILSNYEPFGSWEAGELLLEPERAILLAEALREVPARILGVDLWYLVGEAIAENPYGLDLSRIRDPLESIDRSIAYIRNELPPDTRYVSFVID